MRNERSIPQPSARDAPIIPASPAQLFRGHPIGRDATQTVCQACGRRLREGSPVVVTLTKRPDNREWQPTGVYCHGCHQPQPRRPACETHDLVVEAVLGIIALPTTHDHRLCLTAVDWLDESAPTEPTSESQ